MLSQTPAGRFQSESLLVTDEQKRYSCHTKLTLSSEKENGTAEDEFNT